MIKIKPIVYIFSILALTIALTISVRAIGGFTVIPVYPDNQNSETPSFFNLRVTAGQRQEFSVRVNNSGDTDMSVEVSLVTAKTNEHGAVDYSSTTLKTDVSMQNPLAEIGTVNGDAIHIPAGGSVEVPIFIDIPQEGFDGIILGSVYVLRGITDEERENAGMLLNQFAHVIPIRLQERDTAISTEFFLGDVYATVINRMAAISIEIRNPQPRLTMGATVEAFVYPAGSNTPIFGVSNMSVDFAPNSVFPLWLRDREGFGLMAGDYFVTVKLEHDGIVWEFEHPFTIEAEEAEAVNAQALNIQQAPVQPGTSDNLFAGSSGMLILIIGGTVFATLAIIATIFFVVKAQNKKTEKLERELARLKQLSMMTEQSEL
jgi:hypothetical protein